MLVLLNSKQKRPPANNERKSVILTNRASYIEKHYFSFTENLFSLVITMDQTEMMSNWNSASEDFLVKNFPVHRACRDGDVEQLTALMSVGNVNLYEEDDFYGWTPIHWAAYFGKVMIFNLSLGCCLLNEMSFVCSYCLFS